MVARVGWTKTLDRFFARITRDINELAWEVGFAPSHQQQELFDAIMGRHKQIALKSGQGPGKCIVGDSEIWDPVRGRVKADAYGESGFVAAADEQNFILDVHKARSFASGEKDCIRLETDAGSHLELSLDHRVLTPSGWQEAGSLQEGDLVAVPARLPFPTKEVDVKDEEVELVGYLLGDGGTTESCKFTQKPGPTLNRFLELAHKYGDGVRTHRKPNNKASEYAVSGMRPWLKKMGLFGCSSHTKRVPAHYYNLPASQVVLLIKRMWECDGTFTKEGPEMTLCQKPLLDDFRFLLLRLGIYSRIRKSIARCGGKVFDKWTLCVSGSENRNRWKKIIGEIPGKPDKYKVPSKPNSNTDFVPLLREDIRPICKTAAQRQKYGKRPRYIGRQRFHTLVSLTGYEGEYLRYLNDIRWESVKSKKTLGLKPVFDLEVPDRGNFVCQNIVVHNSASVAIAGLWRALRVPGTFTCVVAPTMRQVEDVCIGEASRWFMERHPDAVRDPNPLFRHILEFQKRRIIICGDSEWNVRGVTGNRAENVQGLHHPNMTMIFDEASGVIQKIWEAMKGTMTHEDPLFLAVGNPNSVSCGFYDCFNLHADKWHCMTWNAEESPFVSKETIESHRQTYGRNSDFYRVRVLGEFPLQNPNTVFNMEDLQLCTRNSIYETATIKDPYIGAPVRQFGIDLARYGSDESVIYQRQGNAIIGWDKFVKTEPYTVVKKAFEMQKRANWRDEECTYVVDAGGIGGGILGFLYESGKHVVEFNSSGIPSDPEYKDMITEAYFQAEKLVRAKKVYIPVDEFSILARQLTQRLYKTIEHQGRTRTKLESKEDWRKRLEKESPDSVRSPDRADAFVMAFYDTSALQCQVA